MARQVVETKGPVGEESPPVPAAPDLAQVLAAQAKLGELLGQVGPVAFSAAANVEQLGGRIAAVERALLGIVDGMRQLHGLLQEVAQARRF